MAGVGGDFLACTLRVYKREGNISIDADAA